MRYLIPLAALLLSSCGQSEFDKAEARYEFLKKNGATDVELCGEAAKVAAAAADAGKDHEYKWWDVVRSGHCTQVQLDQLRR